MTEITGSGTLNRNVAEWLGRKTTETEADKRNRTDVARLGASEAVRKFLPTGNADRPQNALSALMKAIEADGAPEETGLALPARLDDLKALLDLQAQGGAGEADKSAFEGLFEEILQGAGKGLAGFTRAAGAYGALGGAGLVGSALAVSA